MLDKLCNISSPASYEERIKEFIISKTKEYVSSYYVDSFGNLILNINGDGDKKIIECGIDEPFLMANHFEDNKQFFTAPPHFRAEDFKNKEIVSDKGLVLKVLSCEDTEKISFSDLYAKTETETEFGKLLSYNPGFVENKRSYSAENIIYKAPLFAIVSAIRELKDCNKNISFLFSCQKLLAARGLRAYFSLERNASVLSVSCVKEDEYVKCGKGVVICVKEKSSFVSQRIKENLVSIAECEKIDYIPAILSENFNLKAILTSGAGAECGLLCVPYDKKNKIFKSDIKNLIKLVISYCKQ